MPAMSRPEGNARVHIIEGVLYLTSRETAARLGIHGGTLRNWRTDGLERLPHVKLGASVLYKASDVEAYVARRDSR
jgi:excisionase family DNA binding protein